jgi:hypothetical protein
VAQLTYKNVDLNPIGFSDAYWAGNLLDRKSISGYIFLIAGGEIACNSEKQITTALSSTEAEYVAMTQAVE